MSVEPPVDAKLARRRSEDRLGRDIIDECRVQLMLKFRFLDLALWRMDLEPLRVHAAYPLATDAKQVVFDPPRVIARFGDSFDELIRDYLHLVMHCIFRHPFDEDHSNREAWNLTCDIIVESVVLDMCGGRFESEDDVERRRAIDEIKMQVGTLVPGKVYNLVKGVVLTPDGQHYRGMGRSTLNEWHALFERDDHAAWPANNKSTDTSSSNESEEVREDDENPDVQADGIRTETPDSAGDNDGGEETACEATQATDEDSLEDEETENEEPEGSEGEGGEEAADESERDHDEAHPDDDDRADRDSLEQLEKEWEEISNQIEMNLETFSRQWGEEAGNLMAHLAIANRKVYDYSDFLRRFMVPAEEMLINQDEFDYVYYTYGMELYGNMPLVEPLEYKETERVRDFAVVIDTSESVSGELVKRFVEHTFAVLKESEDYARKVNVHIVQCDSRVQSDTVVEDLRDVDAVMERFAVRGFGGTDFRPAFDYIDMLRKRGDLADMKGLIYFTDGLGQFPEKAPDYDAAFVFMDDEGRELPPVPPWAMKIVIDEAGINRLKRR